MRWIAFPCVQVGRAQIRVGLSNDVRLCMARDTSTIRYHRPHNKQLRVQVYRTYVFALKAQANKEDLYGVMLGAIAWRGRGGSMTPDLHVEQ